MALSSAHALMNPSITFTTPEQTPFQKYFQWSTNFQPKFVLLPELSVSIDTAQALPGLILPLFLPNKSSLLYG